MEGSKKKEGDQILNNPHTHTCQLIVPLSFFFLALFFLVFAANETDARQAILCGRMHCVHHADSVVDLFSPY